MFSTAFHSATCSICVYNILLSPWQGSTTLAKSFGRLHLVKGFAVCRLVTVGSFLEVRADAICRSASQQIKKHETLLKKDEKGCACWFWNYDNIPMLLYMSDSWLPLFSQNPKDWVCAWLITPTKLMSRGGTLPCNFVLGGFPWISFASALDILLWFRVISGEVPGNRWVWRCHVA